MVLTRDDPALERVVALCRELIRTQTVFGNEGAVAEIATREMRDLGFDEVRRDALGNVLGFIHGDVPGLVLFDAHTDTVGVGEVNRWQHDPFGAEIEDEVIFGRGSVDMKGSLAAMLPGIGRLAAEPHRGRRTIVLTCTVAEETIEGIALAPLVDDVRPDYVVIGEPTSMELAIGQRGRGELYVDTIGKPAHSAFPQEGINAMLKMVDLLPSFTRIVPPRDELLGEGILVPTDIMSFPYPSNSVIPERCRVTFDRRLLPGETEESVLVPLRQVIAEAARRDPELRAEAGVAQADLQTYTGERLRGPKFNPGWKMPADSPLVWAGLEALERAGVPPRRTHFRACTNGSVTAGRRGIPTLGFGPGGMEWAHQVDERIEIASLVAAVEVYAALGRALAQLQAAG